MMCHDCSGVHRSMGVQYSKVRSITLDQWEPLSIDIMLQLGNKEINNLLEYNLNPEEKINSSVDIDTRTKYIKEKYIEKIYFKKSEMSKEDLNILILKTSSFNDLLNV